MFAAIELVDVTKQYGRTTALDQVSLKVPPGCVFALLGENGAGKTTAIRLMLGLVEATAGEVRVLGLDSRRDGLAIRRRVGYLPERPTLYEWMTAAEIGWFTSGFYADGFEHHYRTLVEGFHVPLDRKLSQLSKGMRAKITLSLVACVLNRTVSKWTEAKTNSWFSRVIVAVLLASPPIAKDSILVVLLPLR